jgi:hypothetical protein
MRATVLALALLVIVAVTWCGQAVRKAERSTGNDLVGYLAASDALYAGQDPYHLPDRFPYIYPLFLAMVVQPLAALDVRPASVLWSALQWGCLLFVLRDARLRLGRREIAGAAAIAVIIAVFGDILQSEFLNGQVNLFVLALVVGSIAMEPRRPLAAAALLGAAIAIKLTPALMLVYWIVRRRFAVAALACGWAVVFVLLPWFVVGARLWTLYGTYLREFIFARTSSGAPHQDEIFFSGYGFIGWLTGSPPGRAAVIAAAVAVVVIVVAWHWRLRAPSAELRGSPAWVYLAATPLLSPMSEVHHLTAALPLAAVTGLAGLPFAVLIWIGRFDRRGPWYFLAVVSLLVAGCMVIRRRSQDAV